tara:strand:+ start:230 stop:394 length:165 start_codon:yes stop_codon:yes gene_type:complete
VKDANDRKIITYIIHKSESSVLEEQEIGIVRLTLNRPEQLNSLSGKEDDYFKKI